MLSLMEIQDVPGIITILAINFDESYCPVIFVHSESVWVLFIYVIKR